MKKLFTLLTLMLCAIGVSWADEVTVGRTVPFEATATAFTYTGYNDGTTDLISVTQDDLGGSPLTGKSVSYNGTAITYSSLAAYRTRDADGGNVNNNTYSDKCYAGMKVVISDGYKLTVSKLFAKVAVGDDAFKYKVVVTDGTNTLYESQDKTAKKANANTATITPPTELELTGIVYVRLYFTLTSTGTSKYIQPLELSVTGELTKTTTGTIAVTQWVKTAYTALASNDEVVIVDETTSLAMLNSNGTSSAPGVPAVTLNGGKITSEVADNIKWVVTVDGSNYKFNIPETTNYLYTTNANNGVRVGTNDNNSFTFENHTNEVPFLKNVATSRYLGIYNSQDWRCYTTVNPNIQNTVIAFYKKVVTEQAVTPATPSISKLPQILTFPDYNQAENASYLADDKHVWTADVNGAVWTLNGFNNQNNAWNYVAAGRKNAAVTSTILSPKMGAVVKDIVFTVDETANVEKAELVIFDEFDTEDSRIDITDIWTAGEVDVQIEGAIDNQYLLELTHKAGANGSTKISQVALYGEGAYTHVLKAANIAAFNALAEGDVAELTLTNAKVLAAGNKNIIVEDATGRLDIYDIALNATVGQVLNGKLIGTYTLFNGMNEMKKVEKTDLTTVTITDGEAPVAKAVTLTEAQTAENALALVTITDAVVKVDGNNTYAVSGEEQMQLYDTFKSGFSLKDGDKIKSITGIVIPYKEIFELAPRTQEDLDIEAAVEPQTGVEGSATYALQADEAHKAGETVDVKAEDETVATLTFGFEGGNDFGAAKANGSVEGFVAFTEGNGQNGKETEGTNYIIAPKYDGKVQVAVVLNNGKSFFVTEDGTALANYNGITVDEKYYGTFEFDVVGGKTYKVYCTGSKLGFYGFNYTFTKPGEEPVAEVDNRKWDFTQWSDATVSNLKADAAASMTEGWSDVEKKDATAPTEASKDNCFWAVATPNEEGQLTANGVVIEELKGLVFNTVYTTDRSLAIAVNYPETSLGTYAGGSYLWLGSKEKECFTIPAVKAGSTITLEVESHKTTDARGVKLYKVAPAAARSLGDVTAVDESQLIGEFTPTTKDTKTFTIDEDCDVLVTNTNGCHIYSLQVQGADNGSGAAITFKAAATERTITVGLGAAGKVSVDWGDGTPVEKEAAAAYDGWDGLEFTGTPSGEVKIYGENITYLEAWTRMTGGAVVGGITSIDLSKATALTEVDIHNNELTTVDLSKNTALTKINVSANKLTAVDFTANTEATYITLSDNQITSFKLPAKVATLYLSNNPLGTLDLSPYTTIRLLYALNCELTEANLGNNNVAKPYFSLNNNKLTKLDVSKQTELSNGSLFVMNNNLSELTLPEGVKVKALNATGNKFDLASLYEVAQNVTTLTAASQQDYEIAETISGSIDLSKQAVIGGEASTIKWFTESGTELAEGTDFTVANGVYTFVKAQDEKVYATLLNTTALKPLTTAIKTTLATVTVGTGINTINGTEAGNGTIYNINGQKVQNLKKGLYIINGKKVVVK